MMASSPSSSPPCRKPLRLKDFLRDDPSSDSGGGTCGFPAAPRRLPEKTVRYLLAVELGDGAAGGGRTTTTALTKCRSKGALTKLTAVINAVKMLPFSASASGAGCGHSCVDTPHPKQGGGGGGGGGGFLPRSFSRKLSRRFWRTRDKGEHPVENTAARTVVRVKDIVRLRSFCVVDETRGLEPSPEKAVPRSPPSPVRSTHSRTTSSGSSSSSAAVGGGAWSDSDSAGSDSFYCGTSVCCGELKDGPPPHAEDANHRASPRCPYTPIPVGGDSIAASTCCQEQKTKEEGKWGGGEGVEGCPCQFEEEKDQLSPVSVMDFPFQDDDDDNDEPDSDGDGEDDGGDGDAARVAASPASFRHGLANLERTKHELLQKIREFERLAALVDPVDLVSRFESSEDENEADRADHQVGDDGDVAAAADGQLLQFQLEVEERALALLRDLKLQGGAPAKILAAADELLVDFFIERLSCPPRDDGGVRSRMKRRPDRAAEEAAAAAEEEALLRTAEDWLAGRRPGEAAKGWQAELREMEMDGRWRRPHVHDDDEDEDEEEIAGGLGDGVLDGLLDELLTDLC